GAGVLAIGGAVGHAGVPGEALFPEIAGEAGGGAGAGLFGVVVELFDGAVEAGDFETSGAGGGLAEFDAESGREDAVAGIFKSEEIVIALDVSTAGQRDHEVVTPAEVGGGANAPGGEVVQELAAGAEGLVADPGLDVAGFEHGGVAGEVEL